jgi:hypothetical protein
MDLTSLLKLLPVVGPVIANAGEFVNWFNQAAGALKPKDQATAKAALADIQADNDAGHQRLQDKLAEAAKR